VWEDGGRQGDCREGLGPTRNAALIAQDELLNHLFPGEITDIPQFVGYSPIEERNWATRLRSFVAGSSVVLDFPDNTKAQRFWFRELFERVNPQYELHSIDASGTLCKDQLTERSKKLPAGAPWTTDA